MTVPNDLFLMNFFLQNLICFFAELIDIEIVDKLSGDFILDNQIKKIMIYIIKQSNCRLFLVIQTNQSIQHKYYSIFHQSIKLYAYHMYYISAWIIIFYAISSNFELIFDIMLIDIYLLYFIMNKDEDMKLVKPVQPKPEEEKAILKIGDKEYHLPILKAALGPDLIDVRSLLSQANMFTYDPGFMCTASCVSRICYING